LRPDFTFSLELSKWRDDLVVAVDKNFGSDLVPKENPCVSPPLVSIFCTEGTTPNENDADELVAGFAVSFETREETLSSLIPGRAVSQAGQQLKDCSLNTLQLSHCHLFFWNICAPQVISSVLIFFVGLNVS
jgi:hypothetical protein